MTAQMTAIEVPGLLPTAAHAELVNGQMAQVALDVEQWLLLSENAALRVRQLGERAVLMRRQHDRLRPQRGAAKADYDAELRAWELRGAALEQELDAERDRARVEVARLSEALTHAQAELTRLQSEAVPAAALQDALEAWQRADSERARLDAELAQHAESAATAYQQARGDAAAQQARQAHLLRGPVHTSPLATQDAADPAVPGASAPPAAQRARLDGMVRLVGEMLQEQPAGAAQANPAGDGRTPMVPAAAALQSRWASFVADHHNEPCTDVNQLIQWVMREAYLATTEDLRFYAYRLRFFTDLKRQVRGELTRARAFQSTHQRMQDGELVLDGPYDKLAFSDQPEIGPDGAPRARAATAAGQAADAKELDAYIKDLEQQLNSTGDDAQLAQVDLQNMAQKQQATLQTLSNLSKSMHETHMAIIRKIGS